MTRPNGDLVRLKEAAEKVMAWLGPDAKPKVAVVLGSGLGDYAAQLKGARSIAYSELGFPQPAVDGHAGMLYFAAVCGVPALFLGGRSHCYEGYNIQKVVFAVRALALTGIETFILTCAAGGVNREYQPGQIVVIGDHLNLLGQSPLVGTNMSDLGARFPDMSVAYDADLRLVAQRVAGEVFGSELKEGVYAANLGPAYETPAEVRMARSLGADLVGMSTVPEVLALRHMGARVLALACVTNMAAGVNPGSRLDHAEVTATADHAKDNFARLLTGIIECLF